MLLFPPPPLFLTGWKRFSFLVWTSFLSLFILSGIKIAFLAWEMDEPFFFFSRFVFFLEFFCFEIWEMHACKVCLFFPLWRDGNRFRIKVGGRNKKQFALRTVKKKRNFVVNSVRHESQYSLCAEDRTVNLVIVATLTMIERFFLIRLEFTVGML